ncbi:hypothetical protein N7448_011365 [Penicillium atrosanguineum]|nr:hypothetical protein N7448_011365 [Penicillium atrosanguineum]
MSYQVLKVLMLHGEEGNDQWVWGYGDPHDGEIKKIERSIQHILGTLARDGPFAGIVGFSSGAAMAAIIASLLEKPENISKVDWKVRQPPIVYPSRTMDNQS